MSNPATKTDSGASFVSAVLATGLAGGALHMAAAIDAGPRALASFGALLGPTAVAAGALAILAAVAFLVLIPLTRAICARVCAECLGNLASPRTLRIGISTAIIVGAALWPLAIGEEHDARACFLWYTPMLLSGLVAVGFVTRCGAQAGSDTSAGLWFGIPLASQLLLAAAWFATYSGKALALGMGVVALVSLLGSMRILARVPALPLLFALAGSLFAAGTGSILRGDGDLRLHHPRPHAGAARRPVVLITVDTLRADFLGEARENGASTPALDALFADSVVFDSARSSAPWTKPSMASILTGLSPLVHGTTSEGVRLPKEVHTFAEHMAGAGYVTAAMGSNVHLEPRFGFAQGFDQYWLPVRKEWGDSLGSSLLERADPKRFPALFPSTEALADVAVEWLTENRDREFFLWIHVLDPHWPYAPPAEHLPERKEGERIGDHWGEHDTVRSVQAGTGRLSAADQERVRGLYRGEIEYVDAQLGRVFETLRELELYDDALIAFTSDHGEEFWEHGTFEHGHTLFDEVLRVPLAFKLPGNSTRAHVDADVPNEALLPTVLEVLGIEPAHEMSSASLVEMWSGGDASARDGFAAGTYYYNEKRMLLTGGMKLIVDYATDRVELYNLADDPDERFPLVGETGAKVEAILEQMKAREALQLQLRESLGIKNAAVQSDSAARRSMRNIGYSGDE